VVVMVVGPGGLLHQAAGVGAVEHGAAALPALTGVLRGPDLGGGDVAEAVVDHHQQVHRVPEGDDVAGQDGGDRVRIVRVGHQLVGVVAAHGAGPRDPL